MLSGSLKERLAQYKTLKEEEKKIGALAETSSAKLEDATPPDPPLSDQPPPIEAAAPDESWVPKDKQSDSDIVNAKSEDGSTKEGERGLDPDISSSNAEESEVVVEEEVVDVDESSYDRSANADESSVNVDESSANVDDASFEEVEVELDEESSEMELEQNPKGSGSDQDVFKALDEADRGDDTEEKGAPANNSPNPTTKNEFPSKKAGNRQCITLVIVFLACVAIVAVVLPFVLDYPSLQGNKSAEQPQPIQNTPKSPSTVTSEPAPGPPTSRPTYPPTDAPTTLQWGQFLNSFLIPISGEEVFKDENSPQYQAAKFILDDPYTPLVTTTGRLNDRYASATFYFATEGDNWKSCYFGDANCASGQWLVDDVCDWHAVSCDDNGRVTSFLFVNAEGNGLLGTLPFEMDLLSAMTDLVIVNNTITGTLPEAFGENAKSIRSLLLPDNDLTGNIPDNYLSNSPLEFVHLGSNAFSGPIPTNIGNTTYLQQLDLSGNLMTGTISEEIIGYEVLEAFSLANNELKGTIPNEIYDLTNLKFLHINGNQLTGTISSSIGGLSSLKELRVGGSELSGHIPDELYALTELVELDASQALLDGRLSLGFLNLEKLEKLILFGNKLVGTVPNSFGQLSTLSDFNLQGNEFSGTIPQSLCLLRDDNLKVLTADCEKVTCECCSTCF